MKIYDIKCDAIYAVGDVHGNFNALLNWIKVRDLRDCAIICCGDIGFGFERPGAYDDIKSEFEFECADRNCTIFMFRGNHDDPSYFDGDRICSEHFKAIPDYSVIRRLIDDKAVVFQNILCVGGAISIDRCQRIKEWNDAIPKYAWYSNKSLEQAEKDYGKRWYWKDEGVVYDANKLLELIDNGIHIDIVCTHTCPSFCQPTTKEGIEEALEKDPELDWDTTMERSRVDMIANQLRIDGHPVNKWVYGHFHGHHNEIIDGVEYIMLDMFRRENNKFDMIEI